MQADHGASHNVHFSRSMPHYFHFIIFLILSYFWNINCTFFNAPQTCFNLWNSCLWSKPEVRLCKMMSGLCFKAKKRRETRAWLEHALTLSRLWQQSLSSSSSAGRGTRPTTWCSTTVPDHIHYLMFYLDYPYIDFTSAFYNFTVIMVFLNCCVNPVIYSIKYEQVSTALHIRVAW